MFAARVAGVSAGLLVRRLRQHLRGPLVAGSPDAGCVIRGSGGMRIVYLTRNEAGEVYLLTLYAKSKSENISLNTLKEIRRALKV